MTNIVNGRTSRSSSRKDTGSNTLAFGSSKPSKLKSRQRCYVCFDYMPIGWLAYFNAGSRQWRHTGCADPSATSGTASGTRGRR